VPVVRLVPIASIVSLVLAISACGLTTTGLLDAAHVEDAGVAVDAGIDSAPELDAATADDVDAAADAPVGTADAEIPVDASDAAVASAFCKASPSLLACFRFEGSVVDESPANHQPTTASNVTYVPGHAGQAAHIGPQTMISIPSAPDWDVATVTIEMWFRLGSVPAAGQRMGLFDSDNRYGVFVYDDGPHCVMPDVVGIGIVNPGEWTHIACVHDGTSVIGYRNGALFSSIPATLPPSHSLGTIAIGSNSPAGDTLNGEIDNLRVWSVARTPDQIAASGKP